MSRSNNVSKKYKLASFAEHARLKSMWTGSKNEADKYVLAYVTTDQKIIREDKYYSRALLKYWDELLVNAIDRVTGGHSNYIEVTFNGQYFEIINNGPGFEIEKHDELPDIYIPEILFTREMAGSEIIKKKDSISGGTNGLGLKIVCANAVRLSLLTVDPENKKLYSQSFCQCKPIAPPITLDISAGPMTVDGRVVEWQNPFTLIRYYPDWALFKMETRDNGLLSAAIEARMLQVAAYCNTRVLASRPVTPVKVVYNGVAVPVRNLRDYSVYEIGEDDTIVEASITSCKYQTGMGSGYRPLPYPWDLCFIIKSYKKKRDNNDVSIIDGVVAMRGTHINHIRDQIVVGLAAHFDNEKHLLTSNSDEKVVRRKLINDIIRNSIEIHIAGAIPDPNWADQAKSEIADGKLKFADYIVSEETITKLAAGIGRIVDEVVIKEEKKQVAKILSTKITVPPEKHTPATAWNKKGQKFGVSLFLTEGDSASTLIRSMLEKFKYFEYFGFFNMRGVPINIRKHMREFTLPDGTKTYVMSRQLALNEVFRMLTQIIGLRYDFDYKTPEQRATLLYQRIIIAVDQDLDGIGKIAPLIQSYFEYFWPHLFATDFVTQLKTPQIVVSRQSDNRIVGMFYYEKDFITWHKSLGMTEALYEKTYSTDYKKGLGGHPVESIPAIFYGGDLEKCLLHFIYDEGARPMFDEFYGKDSDVRKDILRHPISEDEIPDTKCSDIESSRYTLYNAKLYSLDNLKRMAPGPDGITVSHRKVVAALRFMKPKKKVKLDTIAASAITDMNYAHGPASLTDTISHMAMYGPNTRVVPLILAYGIVGLRAIPKGANPRYTYSNIFEPYFNTIFPPEDDDFLIYDEDEGKTYEPRFYVPTDCLVLNDYHNNPATGWAITIWPRNHDDRLYNIRKMIAEGPTTPLIPMRINLNGFTGRYLQADINNPDEYLVGTYTYSPITNEIIITELANCISVFGYINSTIPSLEKYMVEQTDSWKAKKDEDRAKLLIEMIKNHSGEQIRIYIPLLPGAYKKLCEPLHTSVKLSHSGITPIEHRLGLAEKINNYINTIGSNDEMMEYKTYEQPLRDWFQIRTNLWLARQEREIIKLQARIKVLENQIRFTHHQKEYRVDELDDEQTEAILVSNGYDAIDYKLLALEKNRMPNSLFRVALCDLSAKANYNYILDMTVRGLNAKSNERRQKELDAYRAQLKIYIDNPEYYKKLWLDCLNKLEYIYKNRNQLIQSLIPH